MSKKFAGKPCVYCQSNPSSTGDHIFAREFFAQDRRANLPKVPACIQCNNEKSRLEHYLTAILPFAGRHADASAVLTQHVPSRLARNKRLHRELTEGQTVDIEQASGQIESTLVLPFDGEKFERLFEFIVKGLLFYHWSVNLSQDYQVRIVTVTPTGERFFSHLLSMVSSQEVNADLGNGAVIYRGKQGADPQFTVWGFSIYGGCVLADDANSDMETARGVAALTARRDFLEGENFRKILSDKD